MLTAGPAKIQQTSIANAKYFMKVYEVVEATPSKSYCKNTPKHKMSASWASSCKSQGLITRDGDKSHLMGSGKKKKRQRVGGRRIKGAKYGGPLPDWS